MLRDGFFCTQFTAVTCKSEVIMDLKRCLEVLELKNATSISQAKHAYRELVHVWHPDRFPSNSPIKKRADEKIREINIAYENLTAFLSAEHQKDKEDGNGPQYSSPVATSYFADIIHSFRVEKARRPLCRRAGQKAQTSAAVP